MAADDLTQMTDLSLWARMDGHFVFIKLSVRTVERVFKRVKASYALCHPELAPGPSVVRQIIAKSASETLGEDGMWMWDELPTPLELEVSGQSCEERRSAIVEQLNSKPSIPVLRARLDAAKGQKSAKERKLELKSILKHLQDDSANRCESPGHGGSDSDCDSSERDDDDDGRENPDDSEADNGNTQDLERNLQKDALFELHGYEFEVKIRKGIDRLRIRKTKDLSSVYARILKHRQGENECLDALFDELAAETTTSDKLTRWTFNTSSGTARALARVAGRPYLQNGEPNKTRRREHLRQEKLPLIIYYMIDALVLEKGVDALLLYTALQEQSFHFTFAKKEISRADMFEFANNTAQRLGDLKLSEIPDDILVFDPLAVVAWAYGLDFSDACGNLGLTNLAKLGLNFARHFVEKPQDAVQGRLGREFYVPLRDLRMAKPLVQNESNTSPTLSETDEMGICHPQTETLEDALEQVPFSCPRFDPVRDAASPYHSEGAASGQRTTAGPLSRQSHADLQLSPVAFGQVALENLNAQRKFFAGRLSPRGSSYRAYSSSQAPGQPQPAGVVQNLSREATSLSTADPAPGASVQRVFMPDASAHDQMLSYRAVQDPNALARGASQTCPLHFDGDGGYGGSTMPSQFSTAIAAISIPIRDSEINSADPCSETVSLCEPERNEAPPHASLAAGDSSAIMHLPVVDSTSTATRDIPLERNSMERSGYQQNGVDGNFPSRTPPTPLSVSGSLPPSFHTPHGLDTGLAASPRETISGMAGATSRGNDLQLGGQEIGQQIADHPLHGLVTLADAASQSHRVQRPADSGYEGSSMWSQATLSRVSQSLYGQPRFQSSACGGDALITRSLEAMINPSLGNGNCDIASPDDSRGQSVLPHAESDLISESGRKRSAGLDNREGRPRKRRDLASDDTLNRDVNSTLNPGTSQSSDRIWPTQISLVSRDHQTESDLSDFPHFRAVLGSEIQNLQEYDFDWACHSEMQNLQSYSVDWDSLGCQYHSQQGEPGLSDFPLRAINLGLPEQNTQSYEVGRVSRSSVGDDEEQAALDVFESAPITRLGAANNFQSYDMS